MTKRLRRPRLQKPRLRRSRLRTPRLRHRHRRHPTSKKKTRSRCPRPRRRRRRIVSPVSPQAVSPRAAEEAGSVADRAVDGRVSPCRKFPRSASSRSIQISGRVSRSCPRPRERHRAEVKPQRTARPSVVSEENAAAAVGEVKAEEAAVKTASAASAASAAGVGAAVVAAGGRGGGGGGGGGPGGQDRGQSDATTSTP